MKGRVLAVAGDAVTVEPERPVGCFGCTQECKKGLAPVQAITTYSDEIGGGLGDSNHLVPGQMVETVIPWSSFFAQAAAALLPPAAGFITGFAAIGQILPLSGDGPRAAGGAALMFAAGLGMYLFRRFFPAKTILHIKGEM
jgi:hypothetical protein